MRSVIFLLAAILSAQAALAQSEGGAAAQGGAMDFAAMQKVAAAARHLSEALKDSSIDLGAAAQQAVETVAPLAESKDDAQFAMYSQVTVLADLIQYKREDATKAADAWIARRRPAGRPGPAPSCWCRWCWHCGETRT